MANIWSQTCGLKHSDFTGFIRMALYSQEINIVLRGNHCESMVKDVDTPQAAALAKYKGNLFRVAVFNFTSSNVFHGGDFVELKKIQFKR